MNRSESSRDSEIAALERIALKMTSSLNPGEVLAAITEGLVESFGALFARIWLLGPGDLCSECHMASECDNREQCLHLQSSSGLYTNLNGQYRRFPLGARKIGRMAVEGQPFWTNDVVGDPRIPNKDWLRECSIRSFAGYPLVFKNETLGVLAMFSRREFHSEEIDKLGLFARQAAIAVKNAQLFAEQERFKNRLEDENLYLRSEVHLDHDFENIVGRCRPLKKALRLIEQVGPTDTTVLLEGETGTGKELFAHALHARSPRRDRSLVKVNCAALPTHLVESELFGHVKGAFTGSDRRRTGRFELADGGTIFLDEIGELPPETQVKLLRVLQESEFEPVGSSETKRVDTRVVVATNRNLLDEVQAGRFRSDLFYRLNVFPIRIPPLRERREDIGLLVEFFLTRVANRLGKHFEAVGKGDLESLSRYSWPGNIRELQNVIERAAIVSEPPRLRLENLLDVGGAVTGPEPVPAGPDPVLAAATLRDAERAHILTTLERAGWVIEGREGAAARLGVPPSTLRSKMTRHGIRTGKDQ